jgi:hypothetical protein
MHRMNVENRKFLKYLPAWLRSIPNMGAFAVGWLTVMAWLIPFLGSKIFDLQGERGAVFIVFLPLLLPALEAVNIIGKTIGWSLSGHPIAAGALAVILTVGLNMLAAWLTLSFLQIVVRGLRRTRMANGKS